MDLPARGFSPMAVIAAFNISTVNKLSMSWSDGSSDVGTVRSNGNIVVGATAGAAS